MPTGLCMGGGGPVGAAWYVGIAAGLLDEGVDLRRCDPIIGTSAGAITGAWLGAGVHPEEAGQVLIDAARDADPPGDDLDLDAVIDVFGRLAELDEVTTEQARELGRLATTARARDPDHHIHGRIARQLPDTDWPPSLRMTVVDVDTGELVVLSAADQVPLERAAGAASAPAGIVQPVEFDGRRYMDGGMRSGTNADLLLDHDVDAALVIAASDEHLPIVGPFLRRRLDREVDQLRAAGIEVAVMTPDDDDRAAMTIDLLDLSRVAPAVDAGRRRGSREAVRIKALFAR